MLVELFAHEIEAATASGVLRGYRNVDDTSPALRGRVRLADQIARHHGRLFPFEVSSDEFGIDIAENRIIAAALARAISSLARAGGGNWAVIGPRLRALMRAFEGVTPLRLRDPIPAWTQTSHNKHYWNALALAELILSDCGIDARAGTAHTYGIVLKMWRIFEAAVARGLRDYLSEFRVRAQYTLTFGGERNMRSRPDIVVTGSDGVVSVADIKYKRPDPTNADVYQLFTYAELVALARSHIVYAAPVDGSLTITVGRTGVKIELHGIDLRTPSTTFLPQVQQIAGALLDS